MSLNEPLSPSYALSTHVIKFLLETRTLSVCLPNNSRIRSLVRNHYCFHFILWTSRCSLNFKLSTLEHFYLLPVRVGFTSVAGGNVIQKKKAIDSLIFTFCNSVRWVQLFRYIEKCVRPKSKQKKSKCQKRVISWHASTYVPSLFATHIDSIWVSEKKWARKTHSDSKVEACASSTWIYWSIYGNSICRRVRLNASAIWYCFLFHVQIRCEGTKPKWSAERRGPRKRVQCQYKDMNQNENDSQLFRLTGKYSVFGVRAASC